MDFSRRDLCLLLPALAAAAARGAEDARLSSKAYRFEDLAVQVSGGNRFRRVFEGATRTGLPLELHQTELAPGASPHPPHRHMHEEIFLVREGSVEVTIEGKTTRLDPGSVAFIASNDEHGIRNVGTSAAQYFVLGVGEDR